MVVSSTKYILSVRFLLVLFFFTVIEANVIPDLKIKLLNGTKTSLAELTKDGPLMIDFWATWCVPCKKVMKYLDEYHLEYKNQGFKVLMMNTDSPRSIGKVKSYLKSQNHQFLVGLDPNKVISKKLNGLVMPTLILVDKGGEIKWRHQGYLPGEEVEIKKQLSQLLNN